MSTEDNKLPEDNQLSSLYKQAKQDVPAEHIDNAILAAAKHETTKYSLPYNPFSNNWRVPTSLAAVIVLSIGIVTLMDDEFSSDGLTSLAIEEAELFQQPKNIVEEQIALAKAPKPALRQPVAKSPSFTTADSTTAEIDQGQLDPNGQDKKRNEITARKKKQKSQNIIAKETERISLAVAMPLSVPSAITTGTDEQAMLPYWQYKDKGMSIRLIQRLPDQTRGYFVARGFSAEHAELIAQSCVFQTVFKNISDQEKPSAIVYHLDNWVVTYQGEAGKMKTREKWDTQWKNLNVSTPAKLAFELSLLPTTQDYQPGDYNWGMSIFNLTPSSSFTLKLTWQQYGKQRSVSIPNMQCAADTHANPETP